MFIVFLKAIFKEPSRLETRRLYISFHSRERESERERQTETETETETDGQTGKVEKVEEK